MARDRHKLQRTVQELFLTPSIDPRFHINNDVSDATLASSCVGSQNFLSLPILMSKFTEMDHVQNVEKLCQLLAALSYRSLENRLYNSCQKNYPKTLMLIWDSGASFGITLFRSGFIDYVEADIPVKDVTKINRVIGIGTALHKFQNFQGQDIFLPCVLYHLPQIYVQLFSTQIYH